MVIERWSLLIWFLARFCIFLLQLIFSQCGFPEDCTMVYQHSYLNSPSTDSFFFPPIPLCEEKILCSFSGSYDCLRWRYLSFQKLSIVSFLLDNNVLILGLVIEKPILSLLLETIFSVPFHQLCRCRGGISVTRARRSSYWSNYVLAIMIRTEKRLPCLPVNFLQLISGKTWRTKSG